MGNRSISHPVGESTAGQVTYTLPPRVGKGEKEGKGLLLNQRSEQDVAKGACWWCELFDGGAAHRLEPEIASLNILSIVRQFAWSRQLSFCCVVQEESKGSMNSQPPWQVQRFHRMRFQVCTTSLLFLT